jgi:hypothetical protein
MVESSNVSHVDASEDQSTLWLAWDEIDRQALLRETDKYYLPKILFMHIASYLNNYELAKLDASS